MKLIMLLVTSVGLLEATDAQQEEENCGYDSCPEYDPNSINVHIVPHTHNDVGWLKTVDEYFYGSYNDIQNAGVQYILDTVVRELWEDPSRRFIYVETAYFWKWWTNQPNTIRSKVQVLVRQGRLQFAGGAWSMNDEATTHYQSIIDQFTWGLRKLNETFGKCGRPLIAWQIDAFGHSREFASLIATMGYDGLFIHRIDDYDRNNRIRTKRMEMIWRGDDDIGLPSDIFTTVLLDGYSPPSGFCFDVMCTDEPIVEDKNSPAFNIDAKVDSFIEYINKQKNVYRTNNVLIPFGGDFNFQDAGMFYRNMDILIKHTNKRSVLEDTNIIAYYSTPACYLKAVRQTEPTLPLKQDDFFPYFTERGYWTGFYTSRPTLKNFEREGNRYLQMVKQLQVLANLDSSNEHFINDLKGAMGVLQHHDAITGTAKQHVANDYARMLDSAIHNSLSIVRQVFNKYIFGDPLKLSKLNFKRCSFNESTCHTTENKRQFVVAVYNPLAWQVTVPIKIPVTNNDYEVFAPNGDKIQSQSVEIDKILRTIPIQKPLSNATHEIVFIAHLHGLSYKTFYIRKKSLQRRRFTSNGTNDDDFGKRYDDDDQTRNMRDDRLKLHPYVLQSLSIEKREVHGHSGRNQQTISKHKPRKRETNELERLAITNDNKKRGINKQSLITSTDDNKKRETNKQKPMRPTNNNKKRGINKEKPLTTTSKNKKREIKNVKHLKPTNDIKNRGKNKQSLLTTTNNTNKWELDEKRQTFHNIRKREETNISGESGSIKDVSMEINDDEHFSEKFIDPFGYDNTESKEKSVLDGALEKYAEGIERFQSLENTIAQLVQSASQVDEKIRISKSLSEEMMIESNSHEVKPDRKIQNLPKDLRQDIEKLDDDVLPINPENITIENENMKISFNKDHEVEKVTFKDGTEIPFSIRNHYYTTPDTTNENEQHASGAYVFSSNVLKPITTMKIKEEIQGHIMKEVRLQSQENVYNTVRVYQGIGYIECEWIVGPINVDDRKAKEYVIKYKTDFKTHEEFYTDSNGRQMIKRRKDKRATFEYDETDLASSNYYPVTNKISINNDKYRMAVLTDRAQGGSSLNDGEIELMLHRRLTTDDWLGINEALDETVNFEGIVVRGTHRVVFSDVDDRMQYVDEKKETIEFHLRPIVLVADATKVTLDEYLHLPNRVYSWITNLPLGINLLTLESWGKNKLLLRLENYYEKFDAASTTVEVNITNIFKEIRVVNVNETLLGANIWYEGSSKWLWHKEKQFSFNFNEDYGSENGGKFAEDRFEVHDIGSVVHLQSKQIRTFIVEYVHLKE